jgi:hypothetical protein
VAVAVVRPEVISQRVLIPRGRTRAHWKALSCRGAHDRAITPNPSKKMPYAGIWASVLELARTLCDLLARYRDPHLQRPTISNQKSICPNKIMQESYGPRRIFLPAGSFYFCPTLPYLRQNPTQLGPPRLDHLQASRTQRLSLPVVDGRRLVLGCPRHRMGDNVPTRAVRWCAKVFFLVQFMLKPEDLPRQARDKHYKNWKKT